MSGEPKPTEARESRQLLRLLLVALSVGALLMIAQILSGESSEESGRVVVSLAAIGVAALIYRIGTALAAADDELAWFGHLLRAVAVVALAATVLALWEAMDGEDYAIVLLYLLALLFFALAARAGQRLMLSDHHLSWIGSLALAVAAIGFSLAIAAIWSSRDEDILHGGNEALYKLATVSALLTVALAHTSVLLRTAQRQDPEGIALIRVATICLAFALAGSISIDVIDDSLVADPQLIGVLAVLYALALAALPVVRRLTGARAVSPATVPQSEAAAPPAGPAVATAPASRPASVRPAYASDAEAIAAIYNQGIEDREATFQTRLHEPGELELKLEQRGGALFVAERDDEIVGWAGWSGYDDPAEHYAGIGECAVYVARQARGGGVGAQLLEGLAVEAPRAGIDKLVAKIFTTNEASIALFRRCGFRDVGTHLRHGRLEGEWRDVLVLERLLDNA